MHKRTVVHFDLDSFFVSVERLKNSKLESMPVVVGGSSARSVVASCSYEARKYGVISGMPIKKAKIICPEAVFVRGDMDDYNKYSNIVTEIIQEESPLFEKAGIDEFYIDITGMDKFFGSFKWTKELKNKISKNSGLPISFGISVNKTVSKIATGEAKPKGEIVIKPNNIKSFLDPLHIRKIPMIGKKTCYTLESMGVKHIRTIRKMQTQLLVNLLGKSGKIIWEKANGIDNTPIIKNSERASISTEQTFNSDTTDIKKICNLIVIMTEKLAYQLRQENKMTACIMFKIRYSDYNNYSMQKQIPYTCFDHKITPIATELFLKLYQKRLRIRLIGIKFTNLIRSNYQMSLFDNNIKTIELYKSIDKIKNKYGYNAVSRNALNSAYKKTESLSKVN